MGRNWKDEKLPLEEWRVKEWREDRAECWDKKEKKNLEENSEFWIITLD